MQNHTSYITRELPDDMNRVEVPDLRELLARRKDEIKSEINCISVGTINSFDSATQSANILINYKRIIKGDTEQIVDYPLLISCPVVILNGGGGHITFPITSGDTCLVLFCDRDIDNWIEYGKKDSPPNSSRVHDLSDGVALVGVYSKQNKIASYDGTNIKISLGNGFITIDPSGDIVVQGPSVGLKPNDSQYITIDSSGNITIKGTAIAINGTTVDVTGLCNIFGAWVDKSSNYGAQQATTDGIVCFSCYNATQITAYSDIAADPTTIRLVTMAGYSLYAGASIPVKKGNYWKIVFAGSPSSIVVWWIPLGG